MIYLKNILPKIIFLTIAIMVFVPIPNAIATHQDELLHDVIKNADSDSANLLLKEAVPDELRGLIGSTVAIMDDYHEDSEGLAELTLFGIFDIVEQMFEDNIEMVSEVFGDRILQMLGNIMGGAIEESFNLVDIDPQATASVQDTSSVVVVSYTQDTTFSDVTTPEQIKNYAKIPDWVKNNAKEWTQKQGDDELLDRGIQFLIQEHLVKEKIISIQNLPNQDSVNNKKAVPSWIKNNVEWWIDDRIPEEAFVYGLKYMLEHNIIRVD